ERDFLTKVASALTLSASIAEGSSSPSRKPRAAMMCAAPVNWTLVAGITSPAEYVMLTSTIRIQVFFTPWEVVADSKLASWRTYQGATKFLLSISFAKPATIRIRDFHCYGYTELLFQLRVQHRYRSGQCVVLIEGHSIVDPGLSWVFASVLNASKT